MMARLMLLIWSIEYLLFMYSSESKIMGLAGKRNFKLGILVPFNGGKPCTKNSVIHGHKYSQAILVAMDEIQNISSWNFNLSWVWNDTKCDESVAIRQQFWQHNNGVDAFIGPALSCAASSRNAVAFNNTVMSYHCKDALLANKNIYNTIARTSISDLHLTEPLLVTLRHFKWKRVAIIYEKDDQWTMIFNHVSQNLKDEKNNINVAFEDNIELPINLRACPNNTEDMKESIRKLRTKARIVVLLLSHRVLVEYMRYAYEEGLVQTGEYVFIAFLLKPDEPFQSNPELWYFSHLCDNASEEIMKSFGATLIIRARPITDKTNGHNKSEVYEKFSEKIKRFSHQPPFKSDGYEGCLWLDDKENCNLTEQGCKCIHNKSRNAVPLEACNLYHAITQYAYALNRTLASGSEPTGVNIVNSLKRHTFDSIFGFKMTFNDQADVLFNMTLLHQDYVNGTKENTNCQHHDPSHPCLVMKTFAEFWINKTNAEQIFRLKDEGKKKTWYGGRPDVPPDAPPCGFENERCTELAESDNLTIIIGSVSGILAVFLLLLLYNIYRQYSMEKKLHSLLWKIDFSEFSVNGHRGSQISIESGVGVDH